MTVFESPELAAQAIVFDSHDNLYVGTSPDGKVYKVTPDGQKSVFFEPKTKYIWALAIDSNGSLFVATGDSGQIFVVGPDGKGKLFYQSDERHARSLAFDAKGNLLVGTDPNGLILRIEVARKNGAALPDAGASFVVYETSKKEVTALLMDPAGNLYASAIGEKNRPPIPSVPAVILPQPAQPQQITTPQQSGISIAQIQAQTQNQAPFSFFPSTSGGSEVIKIGLRRLARVSLDLARRTRLFHGTFTSRKNPARHGKQRRHHRIGQPEYLFDRRENSFGPSDQPCRRGRRQDFCRHRKPRKNIYDGPWI